MKLTVKPMFQALLAVLFAIVFACSLQVGSAQARLIKTTQPTPQASTQPTTTEQSTQSTLQIMPTMPTMPTILPTLPTISPKMLKEFPPCKPGQSELIVCNPNPEK